MEKERELLDQQRELNRVGAGTVVSDVSDLVYIKSQGGEFRWITISTVLLALGAILHLVAPSVAGITPNFLIATYVTAILLMKPTYRQCLGIGLVAGLIEMMTSKSAFPYGNLASETVGTSIAYVLATKTLPIKIGKVNINPFIGGFLCTAASGATFVYILHLVVGIPLQVVLFVIMPVVLLVAAINLVVTGLLYFPAVHFLTNLGVLTKTPIKSSDHSMLDLRPSVEGKVVLDHVTYTYARSEEPAISDISLAVEEGEFLLIAGPSGCGKTTLAMTMVGAIPHFFGGRLQGMAYVHGQAITQTRIPDLAMTVGTVLADYDTQLVTMTVGEEVAFPMENRGFSAEKIKEKSRQVLAQVGLAGLEDRKVSGLSGGQRQRLAIAAALVTEPELLVLDEPTSALDPEGTKALYKILGQINKEEGITVVVVEDAIEESIHYADRIALLEDGQLEMIGTVDEVLAYMYNHQKYIEALPKVYKCKRDLEKEGIDFSFDDGGALCLK